MVVQPDRVTGPSVADNSLGLAVLAAMPAVLERLGLSLRSTVLGLACSRGLGRGNLEGVRFFLEIPSCRCGSDSAWRACSSAGSATPRSA